MNKFLCVFCILLFIFKTENVFSNNLIYDVNNIEVSGKINKDQDNSKLIEEAFQKAFSIFISKTLLKKDAKNLNKIKIETIKDLVLTYQIIKNRNEKNKKTYLTLNIKLNPKKINNFLAQRKISYADISNISLTLFPILIKKNKEILLYQENFFYKNWIESNNIENNRSDKLINYNLALENVEDLEYINKNKENLDGINIKNITSFKEAKNYALVIIYSTNDGFKAYIKTSINKIEIDRSVNLKITEKNYNKSYDEAIIYLKEEIDQIWKEQNLIDVNTPSFLDFFLAIGQTNDYLKLKSILDEIDVIENYSVLEMTNDYSKIRIKYKGKVSRIKNKLKEKKINIEIINNIWKLKIS
jgi:hypothetical protein